MTQTQFLEISEPFFRHPQVSSTTNPSAVKAQIPTL